MKIIIITLSFTVREYFFMLFVTQNSWEKMMKQKENGGKKLSWEIIFIKSFSKWKIWSNTEQGKQLKLITSKLNFFFSFILLFLVSFFFFQSWGGEEVLWLYTFFRIEKGERFNLLEFRNFELVTWEVREKLLEKELNVVTFHNFYWWL